MKLLGMLLIVLCTAMTGNYLASGLSTKVRRVECGISLLGMLSDRLKYLRPPTQQLIEAAAKLQQYQIDAPYLQVCCEEMRRGKPFPESWRTALSACEKEVGTELCAALYPLGEVLGSTDLESQIAALSHTVALLENRLLEARKYRDQHTKLYRSLGILGGFALVILFF